MDINLSQKQNGAVLLVSLIMLVVLSILSLSAIESSMAEEKLSHNVSDSYAAFEAAEVAAREAEIWLMQQNTPPVVLPDCVDKNCVRATNSVFQVEKQQADWWYANAHPIDNTLPTVATQPVYVLEFLQFVPDNITASQAKRTGRYYYRITARGTGLTNDSVRILQTTFARRY